MYCMYFYTLQSIVTVHRPSITHNSTQGKGRPREKKARKARLRGWMEKDWRILRDPGATADAVVRSCGGLCGLLWNLYGRLVVFSGILWY